MLLYFEVNLFKNSACLIEYLLNRTSSSQDSAWWPGSHHSSRLGLKGWLIF